MPLLLLLQLSSCQQTSSEDRMQVILIHSFEKTRHNYPLFNHELINTFHKNKIYPELHTFYLDCEGYLDKEERKRMYNYLDSIAPLRPDIILVNDDQATYS